MINPVGTRAHSHPKFGQRTQRKPQTTGPDLEPGQFTCTRSGVSVTRLGVVIVVDDCSASVSTSPGANPVVLYVTVVPATPLNVSFALMLPGNAALLSLGSVICTIGFAVTCCV